MLEQLATAFPDQIERIKACATTPLVEPSAGTAGATLSMAFVWEETTEGHDYWADLARKAGWGAWG